MRTSAETLLQSAEPSVRLKAAFGVLGEDPQSGEAQKLREAVRRSGRVERLLSERKEDGTIPHHPYAKWYGAHWVLADLADLGYPSGDRSLLPMRDQAYKWLLSREHAKRIKIVEGRVRRCASQEGNAVHYSLALGLADSRTDELAERLTMWQWPDGGWNCDRKREAVNSSFMETLIPLRALALYARATGSGKARAAAEKAADIFLKRNMFKKRKSGDIIAEDFVKLHYPCYWHYDILFGLKVMAEAGYVRDSRCADALDLLESKRLTDGGFPAEGKYYRVTDKKTSGRSLVDWGGTDKKHMNEFVTADALYVLKEAGRTI